MLFRSWTAKLTDANRPWYGVAMSSDGIKQAAFSSYGQIYVSIDSGNTWTAKGYYASWNGVAMTPDGSILVAVAYSNLIYVSEAPRILNNVSTVSLSAPSLSGVHYGDGSNLTGIKASFLPLSGGTVTGTVSALALSGVHYGDGSYLTGIKASFLPLSGGILTGAVSVPSLTGILYGDGSNLTGVIHTQYTPPAAATFTSSVSAPSLSGVHYGDGSNLTGIKTNLTNLSSNNPAGAYNQNNAVQFFTGDGYFDISNGSDLPQISDLFGGSGMGYAGNFNIPPDGYTFQSANINMYRSMAYGNGIYAVVREGGIISSSKARTEWTHTVTKFASKSNDINYFNDRYYIGSGWPCASIGFGNGIFLLMYQGLIAISEDAVNWTYPQIYDRFSGFTIDPSNSGLTTKEGVVFFDGVEFLCTAYDNVQKTNVLVGSSDGINWTLKNSSYNDLRDCYRTQDEIGRAHV